MCHRLPRIVSDSVWCTGKQPLVTRRISDRKPDRASAAMSNEVLTPVPPWADNIRPVVVDPGSLPSFFRPTSTPPGRGPDLADRFDDRERGRWNTFMHSQRRGNDGVSTDANLLQAYNLNEKWTNELEPAKSPEAAYVANLFDLEKKKRHIISYLRKNPYVPLILRGSAWSFSIISLGFACNVFVESPKIGASTIMAIVISCISVPYLTYSIWDEFFGQPLGLRTSVSKMKLIMIDTVLLCLLGACLALNFDTMIHTAWVCHAPGGLCTREKCLVSFLLLQLVLWFSTFMVSLFRMVDRAQH